jgi:hypothetical protein
MGTPFTKGTTSASGERFVGSQVEVGAEDAFKGHATNSTNVRKGLHRYEYNGEVYAAHDAPYQGTMLIGVSDDLLAT